jgi:hypothetical protein
MFLKILDSRKVCDNRLAVYGKMALTLPTPHTGWPKIFLFSDDLLLNFGIVRGN